MQAVLLAAGFGRRLRPLTDSMPKCLVEVHGVSLLENALNRLSFSGKIDEIVIAVGHFAEQIISRIGFEYRGMKVTYAINRNFLTTNNVYSLYLCRDYIHDDCLLLECDLFYEQDLIETIVEGDSDCQILVSPYCRETMNGTAILADAEGRAKSLVIKRDQGPDFSYADAYKTVNVYRFGKKFITQKFLPAIDLYVRTGSLDSYYELVLGSLIYFGNDQIVIKNIDASRWYEIDDASDLAIAEASVLS